MTHFRTQCSYFKPIYLLVLSLILQPPFYASQYQREKEMILACFLKTIRCFNIVGQIQSLMVKRRIFKKTTTLHTLKPDMATLKLLAYTASSVSTSEAS